MNVKMRETARVTSEGRSKKKIERRSIKTRCVDRVGWVTGRGAWEFESHSTAGKKERVRVEVASVHSGFPPTSHLRPSVR